MYSKFYGVDLIKDYFIKRNNYLEMYKISEFDNSDNLHYLNIANIILNYIKNDRLNYNETAGVYNKNILNEKNLNFLQKLSKTNQYIINNKIYTYDIMMWLLSSILTDSNIVSSREILEIFIRKFEVSKIYEYYDNSFKKLNNNFSIIELYILFSLSLSISYCKGENIKYLNTILKLTDILTSLPKKTISSKSVQFGINLIINYEMFFINF